MTKNMHFKILKMEYPAKNPAKFLKPEPEPEPDIEAGYPAGSRFSRISGRFLHRTVEVADEIFLFILLNFCSLLKSFRSFSAAPRREGEQNQDSR